MNAPPTRAEPPAFDADDPRARLSALVDGEAPAIDELCKLWRADADARVTWHAYHLIGDVMRSDDLAATPERDAAFLAELSARLAEEPVLLAPAPSPVVTTRRRQVWLLPAAAAAGFVVVASVMVVARNGGFDDGAALTASRAPNAAVTLAGSAGPTALPGIVEGRFIRDPQLDRYLRAHRSTFAVGAVAVPGGAPRSVELVAPAAAPTATPVSR